MKRYADELLSEYPNFPSDADSHWWNHGFQIDTEFNMSMYRAIGGIEAYTKFAVSETLHRRRLWLPEMRVALKNPFAIGKGIGACAAYYDKLPTLISKELSLKSADQALWQKTVDLYREVRNPLSHGMEASDIEPRQYASVIYHVEAMYGWIDDWCLPEWVR